MYKIEVKKFLASFILTTVALYFYTYGFNYSSFVEFLKLTFLDLDWSTFLIAIAVYLFGYLIFNLVYFFIKAILKNKTQKYSSITITSLIILFIIVLLALNDKLIYEDVKSYDLMTYYYKPHNFNGEEIDSTNYSKFIWIREIFEGQNSLIKEKIKFINNRSFDISGSRIIVDRLYLFRKLLNISDEYEYNVQFEFDNSIHIVDSLNSRISA